MKQRELNRYKKIEETRNKLRNARNDMYELANGDLMDDRECEELYAEINKTICKMNKVLDKYESECEHEKMIGGHFCIHCHKSVNKSGVGFITTEFHD